MQLAIAWGVTPTAAAFWKTHRNRDDLVRELQCRKSELEQATREAAKGGAMAAAAAACAAAGTEHEALLLSLSVLDAASQESRRRNSLVRLSQVFPQPHRGAGGPAGGLGEGGEGARGDAATTPPPAPPALRDDSAREDGGGGSGGSGDAIMGMLYMARRVSMDAESQGALVDDMQRTSAMVKAARVTARQRGIMQHRIGQGGGDGDGAWKGAGGWGCGHTAGRGCGTPPRGECP